jgi:hypothetical protein
MMEIRLGAEAIGTNGKLGEVRRFIIDPESQRAEELTISHTLGGEHVAPLLRVTKAEQERVYLDLDKQAFEALEEFNAAAYRTPGQSGQDRSMPEQMGNMSYEPGALGGIGEIPLDDERLRRMMAPEYDATTPEDEREPMVALGASVLDVNGEKVGQVSAFAVEVVTGKPAHLKMRHGRLWGQEREVPLDWIKSFTPLGVELNVGKDHIA